MSHAGFTRRAYRRRDDNFNQHAPRLVLVEERIPPLAPTAVLIKVHAIAIRYDDAMTAHRFSPELTIPHGILCNEAAGEVIAIGDKVKTLVVGTKVAPITDTENISGREVKQSRLAADEDGVMADYLVFDEAALCALPDYLNWVEASLIPVVGATAWSALKGMRIGHTVLIQGTDAVSLFALKLANAAGLRVILHSPDQIRLDQIKMKYPSILVMDHDTRSLDLEIMQVTRGTGVDIAVETGGTASLIKSLESTKRGGIVSQVENSQGQHRNDLFQLLMILLVERRINLRGVKGCSRHDMEDLCAALSVTQLPLDDLIDTTFTFDEAEEALDYLWRGDDMSRIGKTVIRL